MNGDSPSIHRKDRTHHQAERATESRDAAEEASAIQPAARRAAARRRIKGGAHHGPEPNAVEHGGGDPEAKPDWAAVDPIELQIGGLHDAHGATDRGFSAALTRDDHPMMGARLNEGLTGRRAKRRPNEDAATVGARDHALAPDLMERELTSFAEDPDADAAILGVEGVSCNQCGVMFVPKLDLLIGELFKCRL